MRLQLRGTVVTIDRKQGMLWICGDARGLEQVKGRVRNLLHCWETETLGAELFAPPLTECYEKGDLVLYKSESHRSWIPAKVVVVHPAGSILLDVRRHHWMSGQEASERLRHVSAASWWGRVLHRR